MRFGVLTSLVSQISFPISLNSLLQYRITRNQLDSFGKHPGAGTTVVAKYIAGIPEIEPTQNRSTTSQFIGNLRRIFTFWDELDVIIIFFHHSFLQFPRTIASIRVSSNAWGSSVIKSNNGRGRYCFLLLVVHSLLPFVELFLEHREGFIAWLNLLILQVILGKVFEIDIKVENVKKLVRTFSVSFEVNFKYFHNSYWPPLRRRGRRRHVQRNDKMDAHFFIELTMFY